MDGGDQRKEYFQERGLHKSFLEQQRLKLPEPKASYIKGETNCIDKTPNGEI